MSTARAGKVVGNVLYNYAGLMVGTAIGFGMAPVLIRHLGHLTYGIYALIGSMIGYSSLLNFGIGVTIMRLIATHVEDDGPSRVEQLISTGIAIYSALAVVALVVAAAAYPFLGTLFGVHGPRLAAFHLAYAISAGGMAITFPSAVFTGINQGLHDFRGPNVVALVQALVGAGGMVGAVELGHGLVAVSGATAAASVLAFVAKVAYTSRVHGTRFRRDAVRRSEVARILRISSWLVIGDLAVTVIFNVDTVVVGVVLKAAAVAGFAVTVGATSAMQSLGNSMNSVLLATSATLRARHDRSGVQRLLLESTRMTAVLLGPLVVVAALWGRQLFKLWVGSKFESSAPTLVVMALGVAVAMMQGAAAQFVIAAGKQRNLFFVSVPEAMVNLALSVVFAERYGIIGVALGTAIPTVFTTFGIVMPYASRLTGTSLLALYRRAAVPVIVQAAVYLCLRSLVGRLSFSNLAALAAASLAVVAGCYLISFAVEPKERATYINMVRQRLSGRVTRASS